MSEIDGMVEAAPQDLVVMRVRREIEGCRATRDIGAHTDLLDLNRRDGSGGRGGPAGAAGECGEREERRAHRAPSYCI